MLLTREEFKKQVFERDKHKCIFCGKPAVDAHHIMDRKLFKDGGYYLDNGCSVCSECHLMCEQSVEGFLPDDIINHLNINEIVYPGNDYDENYKYNKWGKVYAFKFS